jgi:hypothetical protein
MRPHLALRTVAAVPSPMSDALMVSALSLDERVTHATRGSLEHEEKT